MDAGAALVAVTLLLVPTLRGVVGSGLPAVSPAPILAEASGPSMGSFWAAPLDVEVEPDEGYSAQVAISAVGTWNSRLGVEAFTLHNVTDVLRSHSPRIALRITFIPKLQDGKTTVAGLTKWRRDYAGALHADVQLRTLLPNGRRMPEGALRQAALHELGHALGLDDSCQKGCVMNRLDVRHPITEPNDNEVLAVLRLRALTLRPSEPSKQQLPAIASREP